MPLYDLYRRLTLPRKIFLLLLAAVLLRIYLKYDGSQESCRSFVKDNNNSIESRINASENAVYQQKKIFLTFFYWEQLTMVTNDLLHLRALAAQGGRQVVVPFVKDSRFHGVPTSRGHHTLGLYYNIVALNESLRLHGHGTLINWDGFQDVCKGKLDVLIHFHYTNLTNSTKNNLST